MAGGQRRRFLFWHRTDVSIPPVPRKGGGHDDWRQYPRCERNTDLCTMRVNPQDQLGWFLVANDTANMENTFGTAINGAVNGAVNGAANGAATLVNDTVYFGYFWDRECFPWLMTWEENNARTQGPWCNRTVCRGMGKAERMHTCTVSHANFPSTSFCSLEFGSYAMPLGRR